MTAVDWGKVFWPQTPLLEIFVRGSLIYLSLFLFFRFVALRISGSLSLNDILVVVLLADASQNAMAGQYTSLTDGLFLIGTILFWTYTIEALEFYFPPARRFLKSAPLLVIKDGLEIKQNMRKQLLSHDELMEQLREQGITDIGEVKIAYMEDDGNISIVKKSVEDCQENARRNRKPWR